MKLTLTESYLRQCLKQARFHEYCKDSDRALTVLQPIWNNIEEPPDLDGLSDRLACEAQLICGSVISSHGTIHQKKFDQELAINLLTDARERAIAIGERDLIAEAEKCIAVAYWRHGHFENAVAYSNTVLSHYSELEQLTDKTCLLTQANLLMLYIGTGEPEIAFRTFEKIKPFVEDTEDAWIKTVFYNQAAGIYVYSGKFEQAIPFLEKTIEYATATKNNCYLGNALNNLANAYIQMSDPGKAMSCINQALKLFLSVNLIFPYAQALETKAQIHLYIGDTKQALLAADEAISLLDKGENYAKLCEFIWTRITVLIKAGERFQAIRQYNKLIILVKTHLSLVVEDSYIAKFDKLLYLVTGNHFDEIEMNFRERLLDEALNLGGGMITASAKILKVDHQRLSKMVEKFPDLREKHQVKQITRRNHLPIKNNTKKTSQNSFAIRLRSNRLQSVGLKKGQVINVQILALEEIDFTRPAVIQDANKVYHCGFLIDMFGMFAFQNENGDIDKTFLISEILLAGQVVGVHDPNTDRFVSLRQ